MVFDDLPEDIDPDELEKVAIERFRALRKEVYRLLPYNCLLKPRNVLMSKMVEIIDIEFVQKGLIEKEDICSVCSETACPHNKVPDRQDRIIKIELLNSTRNLKPQ